MRRPFLLVWILVIFLPIAALAQETQSDRNPEVSEDAWDILTRMTKFISGSQEFSFEVEMGNEVLLNDGQRIELGSNITATLRRPGQGVVQFLTRDGDNATVILDGETISVFSTKENRMVFDTTRQPGDIDASFDYLSAHLGTNDQLRDFFSMDFTQTMSQLVRSGQLIGDSKIAGTSCDNLALRSEDHDAQLWVAKGSTPAPCRIVVTFSKTAGQPQWWAQFIEWNFSPKISDGIFTFSPPEHAERVDFFPK
jgi:hypothetical protein